MKNWSSPISHDHVNLVWLTSKDDNTVCIIRVYSSGVVWMKIIYIERSQLYIYYYEACLSVMDFLS